jgi:hypothetical protein
MFFGRDPLGRASPSNCSVERLRPRPRLKRHEPSVRIDAARHGDDA